MIGIQNAGDDIGVGDRDVFAAAVITTLDRDRRPRYPGPTCKPPTASMRAIVPPPALTVWMSSIGSAIGRMFIFPCVVITGFPWWISATSQLVPPMSKVMMLLMPTRSQVPIDAMTPPAGPERTVATGFSRRAFERRYAAVGLHDVELRGRHAHLAHAVFETAQVIRHDRLDITVDYGRAQPIELADLRQDFVGEREPRFGKFLRRRFP